MRGFIAGAFDLLHPGHLHILAMAKKQCDFLIVGLHVDPSIERGDKNKPTQTVFERYMQLAYCKFVDRIVPYETEADLFNMLETLNFDIRFLGTDYENTDKKITGELSVEIKYIPRFHKYSSTELRERLKWL